MAGHYNGIAAQCPLDAYKPQGTACDDQFDCTANDICNGTTGACTGVEDDSRCEPDKHKCGFAFCKVNQGCGFTPNPATTVCRPAVGSCDVSENCDGITQDCPADTIKTSTDVCQALSCTNATLKPEILCTGVSGVCPTAPDVSCGNYACGSASACRTTCVTSSDCGGAYYCANNLCISRIGAGQPCTGDSECPISNNHCVDGVCCDTTCTGQCEACNLLASPGTCVGVTGAPVGQRPACAADECPAALTVSCEMGCEGAVCAGDECVLDTDCKEAGKYCAAGVCTSKDAPGSACSTASACASGFCTDGVCCDSACLGQCEACDTSGSMGTCSAVAKGDSPHGGRTACATDGSVCGGVCDGSTHDSCKYPFDVVCRPGSCVAGAGPDDPATAIVEVSCVGNGSCPTEQQQLCGVDGCDDQSELCNGACAVDKNACKNSEYCAAGECVPKLPAASYCANDAQCESQFCVDGVCCDARCGEQCAACDVPGAVGTCSAVSGGAHGGRAACGGVGRCGAVCDGTVVASCSFADEKVSCGEAFCSAGVKGKAPVCDGQGVCAPSATSACKSFSCDGLECSTACTKNEDCVKELECRKGECLPPLMIAAVDEGSCSCSVPGSRSGAPASVFCLLGLCAAAALRRRRSAA